MKCPKCSEPIDPYTDGDSLDGWSEDTRATCWNCETPVIAVNLDDRWVLVEDTGGE